MTSTLLRGGAHVRSTATSSASRALHRPTFSYRTPSCAIRTGEQLSTKRIVLSFHGCRNSLQQTRIGLRAVLPPAPSRRAHPGRKSLRVHAQQVPDAIVILAGGLQEDGALPEWVVRRLDTAYDLHRESGAPILLTGGGTPHKAPVLCPSGQVLHESTAMAEYLIKKGVDKTRMYKEWGSYDTIGNGYFVLTSHAIPRGWRNLQVVTSDFHMPRSRAIFEWLFMLAQAAEGHENCVDARARHSYHLTYISVADEGIDPEVIAARREREAQSLKNLQATAAEVTTLEAFHEWFHNEHRCYSVARQAEIMYPTEETAYGLNDKALRSY
eukprot:CAMPEP_0118945114 /NCGR_PEP_ID=MMETSP1169-20130426/41646_1 /TAXON_ID=36882 /ORGANISM="Pyramimonas obovata, Strain CCMP722" /LENGTH=325 /DNA_ID=CAMNT_0006890755 /DNA_START=95 /DNA_END=1072 /DNA_ORIENTATION=+